MVNKQEDRTFFTSPSFMYLMFRLCYVGMKMPIYEGGPKINRYLNAAHELEVVARCAAKCRESTQYSSSLLRGVSLG
jgi:hypothetical protein